MKISLLITFSGSAAREAKASSPLISQVGKTPIVHGNSFPSAVTNANWNLSVFTLVGLMITGNSASPKLNTAPLERDSLISPYPQTTSAARALLLMKEIFVLPSGERIPEIVFSNASILAFN